MGWEYYRKFIMLNYSIFMMTTVAKYWLTTVTGLMVKIITKIVIQKTSPIGLQKQNLSNPAWNNQTHTIYTCHPIKITHPSWETYSILPTPHGDTDAGFIPYQIGT